MTDPKALVEQAAKGDATAFGQLVTRYRALVYALCVSQARLPADAEDLMQEVFIRVHRDLKNLHDPNRFLPWLRQVSRNVCRMWLRRQRGALVPLEAVGERDDTAAVARLRRVELSEIIGRALGQVSAKSREVLALRYLADCSESEIAAALNLLPATVKSRLHEGREQAKRRLLPVVKELLAAQTASGEMVQQILARCGSPGCICPEVLTERR